MATPVIVLASVYDDEKKSPIFCYMDGTEVCVTRDQVIAWVAKNKDVIFETFSVLGSAYINIRHLQMVYYTNDTICLVYSYSILTNATDAQYKNSKYNYCFRSANFGDSIIYPDAKQAQEEYIRLLDMHRQCYADEVVEKKTNE